jgi:hypothetical protein
MNYAKALVAVVGATVASLSLVLEDGAFTANDGTVVAVAFITAIGVYLFPNKSA